MDLPTAREQSPEGVVTDDSVVLEQRCHGNSERCWDTPGICSHLRLSPVNVAHVCPELGNNPVIQWEHSEVPRFMLALFFICKCHQFWSHLPRVSAGQRQQSSVSCAAHLLWPTRGLHQEMLFILGLRWCSAQQTQIHYH